MPSYGQVTERRVSGTALCVHAEFYGFDSRIIHMIKSLNICAYRCPAGAGVSYDGFRCDESGIDDRAQIQIRNDIAEVGTVYFCYYLGIGHLPAMESEENVLLVYSRKRYKGINGLNALLTEQSLVGADAAYYY